MHATAVVYYLEFFGFSHKMELFIFIVLALPICDAGIISTSRKLTQLQQDVDYLRYQAIGLKSDLEELFAWRNATDSDPPRKFDNEKRPVLGLIEMDNYVKSVRAIESRVDYIIKGLSDEKMTLREIVSDTTREVREGIADMQRMVEDVAAETGKVRGIAESNKDAQLALFANLTSKLDTSVKDSLDTSVKYVDNKINTLTQKVIAFEDINVTVDALSQEMKVVELLEGRVNIMEQDMVDAEDVDNKVNTLKRDVNYADGEIHVKLDTVLKQVRALFVQKDWVYYKKSFYKLFPSRKNHADATKSCDEHGAYLVEVDDAAEMAFLAESSKDDLFWIAGTDRRTEGSWRLPSGRRIAYQNWRNGEPNNVNSNEDCAHAGGPLGTLMNDMPCSDECKYFCEI